VSVWTPTGDLLDSATLCVGIDSTHMSSLGRVSTRARELAAAASPWGFPVLYLGWAYLWWVPIALSGDGVWTFPNSVAFLVGGASPALAGLSLLWVTEGRAGVCDLGRRLVDVGRISPRWWLTLLALYPAFNLVMATLAVATGLTARPLEFASVARLTDPGAVALLVAVALVFPAVEEVGLRGYWFDRLQARFSALGASLVLGTVWAAWHVPLIFLPGYFAETTFDPELWWWLPSIVLTAIPGTWVYNNTRRSVLAVVVLHFAGNLTGELLGFAPEMYPFVVLGTAALAVGIVVGYGAASMRGHTLPAPADEGLT
jgi:membrane protease YdiL (CAAX protease family)